MIKVTFILFILSLSLTPAFAQSNQSDTLTITTYYPSPYGVYGTLEVKKGMAVGGASSSTVTSLKPGQLYVGNSVLLKSLSTDPPNSQSKAGQVIYVGGADKMLKFHDGAKWVNCTAPPPPPCPTGQTCSPVYCGASSTCCSAGNVCKSSSSGTFHSAVDVNNIPCGGYPNKCPTGTHLIYTVRHDCQTGGTGCLVCIFTEICVYD